MDYSVEAKVFPAGEGAMLSMNDMLAYFEKQGAMRVSDLHIKIGTQPSYRIDGDLVKLKGRHRNPGCRRKADLSPAGRKKYRNPQTGYRGGLFLPLRNASVPHQRLL